MEEVQVVPFENGNKKYDGFKFSAKSQGKCVAEALIIFHGYFKSSIRAGKISEKDLCNCRSSKLWPEKSKA